MKREDITTLFPDATADQIKKLMDINGADINNAKKDLENTSRELQEARSQLEAEKGRATDEDLQKEREKAKKLQAELDGIKRAAELKDIRERVAEELKIPASLLTAETEKDCKAQAQAILDFARPKGYPSVRDGGEASRTQGAAPRDMFAEWLSEQ